MWIALRLPISNIANLICSRFVRPVILGSRDDATAHEVDMAARGRKPQPPQLPPELGGGAPDKPQTIAQDPVASALWDDLVNDLAAARVIAPSDAPILAALCSAYSRFCKAREILAASEWVSVNERTGAVKAHPLLGVEAGAAGEIKTYASELGLSPTARARIQKVEDNAKAKTLDELLA